MRFDELDKTMRTFETALDYAVIPGIYIVARVDGRGFTRLTKEVHRFEAPYDERFRDYMVETAVHLMQCGFNVTYGHTQSDEISLLFYRYETTFGRKIRKYISVLAGEASAKFSVLSGGIASLDCRISLRIARQIALRTSCKESLGLTNFDDSKTVTSRGAVKVCYLAAFGLLQMKDWQRYLTSEQQASRR
ncbi:MAG TPA: tRNA(His) guanylyltransferase Thg1 family protein [Thermodesulfovibrionales bacterium]|nr:tRNA(His) guanylyltransferase Thg1 family protein [Thermodesulfovibrionales bacterium]